MRSTRKTAGLAAILLFVLFAGTYAVLGWITAQQRLAVVAALQKPESAKVYDEAVKKAREATATSPATSAPPDDDVSTESPPSPSNASMPKSRIAQFELCRTMLDALKADLTWDQVWDAIQLEWPSSDQWTEAQWRQLGEFLAKVEPLFAQIRKLFDQEGPICPLEVDTILKSGTKHWGIVREFARLYCYGAMLEGHAGAYDAALEHIFSAFYAGDLLKNEPMLMSHLTRFACQGIGQGALWASCTPGVLNAGQVDRLTSYAAIAPDRNAYAEALNTEFCYEANHLGVGHDFVPNSMRNRPGIEGFLWELYSTPLAEPFHNRDAIAYVTIEQEVASAARQPYYEADKQLSASYGRLEATWFVPLAKDMGPLQFYFLEGEARYEASLSLMAIGLQLEQFQAETGRVPETLEAVAHYFDGHIPVDPYTGEPFRYVPGEGGFRLYSVGGNREDDGGEDGSGDIVWRKGQSR